MKAKTLLIVSLFLSSFVYAQDFKHVQTKDALGWRVLPVPSEISLSFVEESSYSFRMGIISLNEQESAFTGFDEKLGYAIIKVNSNGDTKWVTSIPGYAIGIAQWGTNIIAFYTPEWKGRAQSQPLIKNLYAVVINAATGEKLKEKIVYENSENSVVDPKVLSTPNQEFAKLLLRKKGKKDAQNSTRNGKSTTKTK